MCPCKVVGIAMIVSLPTALYTCIQIKKMIKPEWVASSTLSDFEDVSTMGSCSAQ